MAVVVQCFHCNAVLELDEGFRGGVCRCSGCGSLLQVPKAERDPASPPPQRRVRPAAPPGPSASTTAPDTSPTAADPRSPRAPSLDASGLSSGLRQVHKTRPISHSSKSSGKRSGPASVATAELPPPPLSSRQSNRLLWISLLLIVMIAAVVVALVVRIMFHHDDLSLTSLTPPPPAASALPHNTSVAPNFAGIPLVGRRVILSVDASVSMAEGFDFLRRGVDRAAERLAPNQPMLVTLWTEEGLKQLPTAGFGQGDAWSKELLNALGAVTPIGAANAEKSMIATLDLAGPGDQVIFVTAKSEFPASLAVTVLPARKDNVRIDGIKLVSQDTPSPFEKLAKASNGQYLYMSISELDQVTR